MTKSKSKKPFPPSSNKRKRYRFYGAESNCFKLDGTVYHAVEDENDGYRSLLDTIQVAGEDVAPKPIFFRRSIATITIEEVDLAAGFVGYVLKDVKDGHEWLEVGTDYTDDYYPMFVFRYNPKER